MRILPLLACLALFVAACSGEGPRPEPESMDVTPSAEPFESWNQSIARPGLLKDVKLDVLSGTEERLRTSLHRLDSLSAARGPVVEAMYWRLFIELELINRDLSGIPQDRQIDSVQQLANSIGAACDDNTIPLKFRKDCDHYAVLADSLVMAFHAGR